MKSFAMPAPFILATHDHLCRSPERWRLRGRKGSWSLWAITDGRCRWLRSNGEERFLNPDAALLRWRGVSGVLHVPAHCRIRGIEFDVSHRQRQPHELYGWQPLENQGPARQQEPKYFFGRNPDPILSDRRAHMAQPVIEQLAVRWWRSERDQMICNLILAGWLADFAESITFGGGHDLERAEAFARRSAHSDCRVADMAREAGMPESSFSEWYAKQRGQSPGAFLRGLRMEQACRDLLRNDVSIAKVAHRAGYRNAASFARSFRAQFSESPTQYRLRRRR